MSEVSLIILARKKLIIAVQVLGVMITLAASLADLAMPLDPASLQALGGSLTTALFVLTLICHMQARKGRFPPGPITLIGAIAPTFAILGGTGVHLMGYHGFAAIAHYLIWVNLNKSHSSPGADEHKD